MKRTIKRKTIQKYQTGATVQNYLTPQFPTFADWQKQAMSQQSGVVPNYNMQSHDTNLQINPNQIVQSNYQEPFFQKSPIETGFENPSNLGLSTNQQSMQDTINQDQQITGFDNSNIMSEEQAAGIKSQYNSDLQNNQYDVNGRIQFMNPYAGVDIPSAAVNLGTSIQNKNPLGIAASALKVAVGLGRNVFGAMGVQNRNNQVMKEYYDRQRDDLTRTVMAEDGGYINDEPFVEFQDGGKAVDNTFVPKPRILPKNAPKRELSEADLIALAHQKRGMSSDPTSFVLNHDGIKNDVRTLSSTQIMELQKYMDSRNIFEQAYEGMPNIGIPFGQSNAEIPSDSVLRKFQAGGDVDFNYDRDSIAPQKPIKHIQKVSTSGYKDHNQLPPGDYYKVYYTDPNKAKIENQDFEYINQSGYNGLQRMSNYKIYMDSMKNSDTNHGLATFQKGGEMTLPKALTGEFMTGMDEENPMQQPNAEVETGEHIQHPDGNIQKVIGNTHEKGGEDVNLEDGTKILSDHLKIGGALAREFRREYKLEVKASDTYAKVLDKYSKKIGLTKIVEEQEELIKKLEKENKETQDEETLGLNTQHLSNKLNELEQEKAALEEARQKMFDELFEEQEESKPNKNEEDEMFQNGGTLIALSKKYNVPIDRVFELFKPAFQSGGNFRVPSNYENPSLYTKQSAVDPMALNYGDLLKQSPDGVVKEIQRLHPEIYQQMFEGNKLKSGFTAFDFQKAIGDKYNSILKDYETLYGKNSPEYSNLANQINQDTFVSTDLQDSNIRARDNKLGNYTVTRPNYILNLLPKEELEKVKKDGVNTTTQLKSKYPDLYKKYVEPKGVTSDAFLGEINQSNPVDVADNQNLLDLNTKVYDNAEEKGRMNLLLLPEQNPMMPGSLQPHLKVNRRFDRVDPALISPEQNIQEINRQQNAVTQEINNMPGAQRAAALATMSANSQDNLNKVITSTNQFNSQAISQADARNAQIQAVEENAAAQDALSYEQRQLTAKAKTDNDINNYYNTLQANNVRNYNEVNNLNAVNAMADHYQFDGQGYVQIDTPFFGAGTPLAKTQAEQYIQAQEEEKVRRAQIRAQAKKKLSSGGRFKK